MERENVTSSNPKLEFPGQPMRKRGLHGQLMPSQIMKTKSHNPYRISATEALENEGFSDTPESLEAFARNALFDATSPACCSEGCIVEPDGTCSHGCPSILIALGLI
jgi:hypothetical protein